MKVLAIGDQHFKLDNITQVEIFISKLRDHLAKEKYDCIVSGGDLLDTHERLHTQCLNKAIEYLKVLSSHSKTFVLVGNHDMINPSQFLTTNHWLNVIKEWDKTIYDIEIIDTPVIFTKEEDGELYKMVLCPYVPDGMFMKALDTLNSSSCENAWKDADIIFGHQTMDGVKMGSIEVSGVEKWNEDESTLVCFHVHDMQNVQKNLFYTGSCMQHSFGESISKHLMKIYIDKKRNVGDIEDIDDNNLVFVNDCVYIRKLNIGVPRRKIINCSVSDLEKMETINDIIPKVYRNDMFILKIVVTGKYNDFKAIKKKEQVRNLMSKYKLIFKQEVSSLIEKDDLKLSYNKTYAFRDIFDDILKNSVDTEMYELYHKL